MFPSIEYDSYVIDSKLMLGPLPLWKVGDEICSLVDEGRLKLWGVKGAPRIDYIAVFSSHKRPGGESCGWHATTLGCYGIRTFVSYNFSLDNDSECDPQDARTGHSQGLAALANQSARALADVTTDGEFNGLAQNNGSGNEIDDMCAWTFSVPYVTFPDGSKWKLQDLWSNRAYEAGTGNPNAWGDRGCITGE